MLRYKVVEGFAGAQVQIVRGGRLLKVDLKHATKEQLKQLHAIGHPAITVDKPAKKASPAKKD